MVFFVNSNTMSKSRQLASIMFTDIVGYTKLMGEDEQKAFELLKKNRAVQRPIIEKYNGKWLKEIGAECLLVFLLSPMQCIVLLPSIHKRKLSSFNNYPFNFSNVRAFDF